MKSPTEMLILLEFEKFDFFYQIDDKFKLSIAFNFIELRGDLTYPTNPDFDILRLPTFAKFLFFDNFEQTLEFLSAFSIFTQPILPSIYAFAFGS